MNIDWSLVENCIPADTDDCVVLHDNTPYYNMVYDENKECWYNTENHEIKFPAWDHDCWCYQDEFETVVFGDLIASSNNLH